MATKFDENAYTQSIATLVAQIAHMVDDDYNELSAADFKSQVDEYLADTQTDFDTAIEELINHRSTAG